MHQEMRFCPCCATPLQWMAQQEDSGLKERLRCPSCDWTHWGNPTPVLAAVVENDQVKCAGAQCVMARRRVWLDYGLHGGGESPEAGICREVLEETGLRTKALRMLGAWEFLRMNQVLIAYHVRVEGSVQLSPELVEFRWQTAQQVRCWPSGTGYALAHWVQSKGIEPQFGAFRPGQSPEPDPAKWPLQPWAEDARFMVAPPL